MKNITFVVTFYHSAMTEHSFVILNAAKIIIDVDKRMPRHDVTRPGIVFE